MADNIPSECDYSSVELLIGNDYYLDILLSQKMQLQPGLYLLSSKLGWMLTGRTCEQESEQYISTFMLILTPGVDIGNTSALASVDSALPRKPDLQDFWNLESIGVTDNPKITDDEIAMQKFRETLRYDDNRYQVTWPLEK
ncbi:hypothetical protein DPMN_182339 [Dreissena polymorpha]|uniref:Peptidase aspartic putative domain-containing protein n=1 Tax=Dreissena polymorpha TaxID=45954 RepID=A0A9D4DHW8_DREPO|nr:hypothetical protein DPMN_182339 [Dreissena polymorpha]